MKLQGIFLPVAIPFDHNGALYAVKVQHNVEKWNRTALAGFVVSGPENGYLSSEERTRMWEWVAEYSAPEKLLIADAGMPGVHQTVEAANLAETLGYRAVMVRVPEETHDAKMIYFRAIADQSKIPVIIDGDLPPESISALEQHRNIAAICRGSLEPVGLQTLANSALTLSEAFAAGAVGAVVPFANAAPHALISIWEAHRTREFEAARDWQTRVSPMVELTAGPWGIAALKHAMDLNGYYGGPPRLPLTVLTADQQKEVERALTGIKG